MMKCIMHSCIYKSVLGEKFKIYLKSVFFCGDFNIELHILKVFFSSSCTRSYNIILNCKLVGNAIALVFVSGVMSDAHTDCALCICSVCESVGGNSM